MAVYARADHLKPQVQQIIHKYHKPLADAEVTVGVLKAFRSENAHPQSPVLTLHGYACLAIVKITSLKDRVLGVEDAIITLNGEEWSNHSDQRATAILDHELHHLTLVLDKKGNVKADDHGRPKLRIRQHDWQLGGFAAIVDRHGEQAVEREAFIKVSEQYRQLLLPWG